MDSVEPTLVRPRDRPPSGVRPGERVRSYPTLTIRLPPESRSLCIAIHDVMQAPVWRIIARAIELYRDRLETPTRKAVEKRFRALERARRKQGFVSSQKRNR